MKTKTDEQNATIMDSVGIFPYKAGLSGKTMVSPATIHVNFDNDMQ